MCVDIDINEFFHGKIDKFGPVELFLILQWEKNTT